MRKDSFSPSHKHDRVKNDDVKSDDVMDNCDVKSDDVMENCDVKSDDRRRKDSLSRVLTTSDILP